CFVAYLLDSGDDWLKCQPLPATPGSWRYWLSGAVCGVARWLITDPIEPRARAGWRQLRWYLAVSWLPLLAALAIPTGVYVTADWPWTGDERDYVGTKGLGTRYVSEGGSLVLGLGPGWCLVFGIGERWPLLAGIALAGLVARGFTWGYHRLYA